MSLVDITDALAQHSGLGVRLDFAYVDLFGALRVLHPLVQIAIELGNIRVVVGMSERHRRLVTSVRLRVSIEIHVAAVTLHVLRVAAFTLRYLLHMVGILHGLLRLLACVTYVLLARQGPGAHHRCVRGRSVVSIMRTSGSQAHRAVLVQVEHLLLIGRRHSKHLILHVNNAAVRHHSIALYILLLLIQLHLNLVQLVLHHLGLDSTRNMLINNSGSLEITLVGALRYLQLLCQLRL